MLREVKFHLGSTLRGLATGGLDELCANYEVGARGCMLWLDVISNGMNHQYGEFWVLKGSGACGGGKGESGTAGTCLLLRPCPHPLPCLRPACH